MKAIVRLLMTAAIGFGIQALSQAQRLWLHDMYVWFAVIVKPCVSRCPSFLVRHASAHRAAPIPRAVARASGRSRANSGAHTAVAAHKNFAFGSLKEDIAGRRQADIPAQVISSSKSLSFTGLTKRSRFIVIRTARRMFV
jgi:hypothetical protein